MVVEVTRCSEGEDGRKAVCKLIRTCFLVLLCLLTLGLSAGFVSEASTETVVQKESEVRVKIINPRDSKLSNDKGKLFPKTGSITSNKLYLAGIVLLLGGAYWIKNRKRTKERDL